MPPMACAATRICSDPLPCAGRVNLAPVPARAGEVTCLFCLNARDFPIARPPVPIQARVIGAGRYLRWPPAGRCHRIRLRGHRLLRRPGEVVMRSPLKALLITASLVAASLGAATSAAAATAPPTLMTTNFACSNGVCEVGPGNVGLPLGAGLLGLPTDPSTCIPYTYSVISGSLPPGLQIVDPGVCGEWTITGTPTQAGTYPFTVQITPTQDGGGGPPGTQQLTITIGTGHSDRTLIKGASWNGHYSQLSINGYDANVGALWSVSVTSTGRVLISNQQNTGTVDGHVGLRHSGGYPCPFGGCDLTVTNSLGSSVTVFPGRPKY